MYVMLNGELLPAENAKVSVLDRSFLYGDGIFETLASYGGRIFRLDAHLDRLAVSASSLRMPIPYSRVALSQQLVATLSANGGGNAMLRLHVSRGIGRRGLDPRACTDPVVSITCSPPRVYPEHCWITGAKVVIASVRRIPATCLPAVAKHANYLNNLIALGEAYERGAQEAFLVDSRGRVVEGATSNVFAMLEGVLYTAPLESGVLPGITRHDVLLQARSEGIAVREKAMTRDELLAAEEIFYTNTSALVMPVGRIDDTPVAGAPGPVTRLLRDRMLRILTESGADRIEGRIDPARDARTA